MPLAICLDLVANYSDDAAFNIWCIQLQPWSPQIREPTSLIGYLIRPGIRVDGRNATVRYRLDRVGNTMYLLI